MSKDFIDNEIDQAHELIKQGGFEDAVNILKLLKTRIHDDVLISKIKKFEDEHDKKLEERYLEINNSDRHRYDKRDEKMKQLFSYAQSYLHFYDKIRKENDIY